MSALTTFAKVAGMSDEQNEPGELTERFQAFARSDDPPPSRALPIAMMAGGFALLVMIGVAVWILATR